MTLPRPKKPEWYSLELWQAAIGGGPPIAMGVAATWKAFGDANAAAAIGWLTFSGTIWLALAVAARCLQAHLKDKKAAEQVDVIDLTGCLFPLHAVILAHKGLELTEKNRKKLRVTIHRLTDDRERVEQLLDYVGGDEDGRGRFFSSRSGVVGRVITTGESAFMHRRKDQTSEEYVRDLRGQWAMPESEAKGLRQDRFSFMGVPVSQGNEVSGVVFFDCTEVDFFAEPKLQEMILAACQGLAGFARLRYKK